MTAGERAEKLLHELPVEVILDEEKQDAISAIVAAIRAAEDAAALKERERLAARLNKEADLYQQANGEPGALSTQWGWRGTADTYRKLAKLILTAPAPVGPSPAPSPPPDSSA